MKWFFGIFKRHKKNLITFEEFMALCDTRKFKETEKQDQ